MTWFAVLQDSDQFYSRIAILNTEEYYTCNVHIYEWIKLWCTSALWNRHLSRNCPSSFPLTFYTWILPSCRIKVMQNKMPLQKLLQSWVFWFIYPSIHLFFSEVLHDVSDQQSGTAQSLAKILIPQKLWQQRSKSIQNLYLLFFSWNLTVMFFSLHYMKTEETEYSTFPQKSSKWTQNFSIWLFLKSLC